MPISPTIAGMLSGGEPSNADLKAVRALIQPDFVKSDDPLSGIGTRQDPQLQRLQLRDIVHSMIAKGITNVTNPDDRANMQYITMIKGEPFARKLINQIALFNQSDAVKGSKNPEDRIGKFYAIGSKDKDIQSLIDSFKGLGGKPVVTGSPERSNINMGMGVVSPSIKGIINSGSQ